MKIIIRTMNNQKHKILLIITKSNFGGAQKYVFELAQELQKNDHEVTVVLGGNGILIEKLKNVGIEVEQVEELGRDISIINDFKTFLKIKKIISKHNPDIVHLNSSKIGALGALASRLARVPQIIFTIHGWAFNEDRGFTSKLIIKMIYFFTILLCHHSIAVSKKIRQQAQFLPFYYFLKKKIHVVYNGIATPHFISKQDARVFFEQKTNTSFDGKYIIGQIAELHPIKSISTTIEAAAQLTSINPNFIFLICGEGEERKKLERQIMSAGLEKNVFLLGFIDNAAQYIKGFDLFCLTSKSEALALVLLEAGLAQVPIIASKVGGIPELIIEEETGFLFESQNTSMLVSQIKKIFELNTNEIKNITDTYYALVQEKHSIEKMVQDTVKIYNL